MSGIFGWIPFGKNNGGPENLLRMRDALKHRGQDAECYAVLTPESQSIRVFNGVEGRERLSALQAPVSAAMGYLGMRLGKDELEVPAYSGDGNLALAFDGAIYNKGELSQELGAGHFDTQSELLLKAYEKWGIDFFGRLNGVFAIEILDRAAGKLYLVRDHHGLKPVFYHITPDAIVWASELKGILKSGLVKASVDMQGLIGVFHLQSPVAPATAFKNTYLLPLASWVSFDIHSGEQTLHRYWNTPVGITDYSLSMEDAGAELAERVKEVVKKQMDTTAPIASLLSGGLDSTLITAFAAGVAPGISTYTLAIDGSGSNDDELPQAKAMADFLKVPQYVHYADSIDIMGSLDASIRHLEEPFYDIDIFFYSSRFLSEKGYQVVLNGFAADRLLAGNGYHAQFWQWKQRQKMGLVAPLIPAVSPYLKRLKNYLQLKTVWQYIANAQPSLRMYQIEELLMGTGIEVEKNLLRGTDESLFRTDTEAIFHHEMEHIAAHHNWRDDVSSMRYGIEMRYPFLDHTLTDWVSRLPLEYRYSPTETKPLSRIAARKIVTEANLQMKKKGYRLPTETWIKKHPEIEQYLLDNIRKLKARDIFNNNTIDRWWADYQANSYLFGKVWLLATTEVWMQEYID